MPYLLVGGCSIEQVVCWLFIAAKQGPYIKKKAYFLKKNIEGFSGKNSGKWPSRKKKDKTERVTGLGRRTREEIVK